MSNTTTHSNPEFEQLINQIRNDTGKRLLNKDERLYLTADEIAHSFTINEILLHNRNQPNK
jgi:DNA-binding transcriptional regulator YhcF (GntR family)